MSKKITEGGGGALVYISFRYIRQQFCNIFGSKYILKVLDFIWLEEIFISRRLVSQKARKKNLLQCLLNMFI